MQDAKERHFHYMNAALLEAEHGLQEGGIPIGCVLVFNKKIIGKGHNQRIQKQSPILHAEMDCLNNAGRLLAQMYRECTLYTTLSPCMMCSGTILFYKIPTVVIADNTTFQGPESLLINAGVELIHLHLQSAQQMMQNFIRQKPELWHEDISMLERSE